MFSDRADEVESDEDLEEENAGPKKDPDLEQPLFPGSDCSKFECLLMILCFSLRHGLSQVATKDLCSMINHILGGEHLPETKHRLTKTFGRSNYLINFYCQRCEAFIISKRNGQRMVDVIPCAVCGFECKLAKM